MRPFVMNPIKTGAVSQGAETAVQIWLHRPGGYINSPAFIVKRVAAASLGGGGVMLQQRVVSIGDPELKFIAPFSLD